MPSTLRRGKGQARDSRARHLPVFGGLFKLDASHRDRDQARKRHPRRNHVIVEGFFFLLLSDYSTVVFLLPSPLKETPQVPDRDLLELGRELRACEAYRMGSDEVSRGEMRREEREKEEETEGTETDLVGLSLLVPLGDLETSRPA